MPECQATQQSDEMYCARCNLRWDVNDPSPPDCVKSFPVAAPDNRTPDRKRLDAVAKVYHDFILLQVKQKETTAKMLRACVHRLKSPDSRKRREAITALEQLAEMLEKNDDR